MTLGRLHLTALAGDRSGRGGGRRDGRGGGGLAPPLARRLRRRRRTAALAHEVVERERRGRGHTRRGPTGGAHDGRARGGVHLLHLDDDGAEGRPGLGRQGRLRKPLQGPRRPGRGGELWLSHLGTVNQTATKNCMHVWQLLLSTVEDIPLRGVELASRWHFGCQNRISEENVVM